MNKAKEIFYKVCSKASVYTGVASVFLFGSSSIVLAADTDGDSYLPDYIEDILKKLGFLSGSGDPQEYVQDRVKAGLTILFVVVFLVAIVYSALAAIKFISSQGDASKLEESKGAVKAILFGFAAMLLAIIGIFVVLWWLGSTSDLDTDLPLTPA